MGSVYYSICTPYGSLHVIQNFENTHFMVLKEPSSKEYVG